MRMKFIVTLLLLGIIFLPQLASATKTDAHLHPTYLRCEYLVDPLGIDVLAPRLSWYSESQRRAENQTAYRILVASTMKKLQNDEGNLWDSGKINSDKSINVIYDGRPLRSGERCFWKVKVWDNEGHASAWSLPAKWSMGLLSITDWKGYWIGLDSAVGNDNPNTEHTVLSARYLRKQFDARRKVKRATAYICGLGYFDLYFNGKRIGNQVLAPALSDYRKRSFYMTFDVTKDIVKGENAIGVILGNGRFFAPRTTIPTKTETFGFPKMIFQLNIEYTDGTKQNVVSDTTWRITADGPIRSNNEYDGEIYDARKTMPGWNKVGFDASRWLRAERVADPTEQLDAQMIAPIKIMQIVKPKSIKEIKPGVYIYDMGQNMVGWVSLRVRAKSGTRVTMRFAETLKRDGELNTANLRSARQTDVFIADGKGLEKWQPRFVYHGFRYVELTGYPGRPDLNTITGNVVYDDIKTIGSFTCSSDIINEIYHAAYWGIRGNYHSIPTDCPQRDERQGWLGDRSTNSYGESYIFDNNALYSNWMTDITDSQKPSGSLPDVAPDYWPIFTDNMTWPSTLLIVPDHLYKQFGNLGVISGHYAAMKKWLWYMRDRYMKDYLLPKDQYGDWCAPPRNPETIHTNDPNRLTPGDFIGSAYFYYCLNLMDNYAHLLNKEKDAKEFAALARKVRDAINNTYLNKDSLYYANNTVTANALALYFGIPPKKLRSKVFDNLVYKVVHVYNHHTSCGLVGEQWIMRTLTNNGRPDLALKFAENTTYPSWGYMIRHDATTIWELWNGNTADPAMNSRNHVMLLGDLVVWLYQDLAGIEADPTDPGYKHILMKPFPAGNLKFVKASYLSMYGLIKSDWHLTMNQFSWSIEIPANTTATIYIPAEKEIDVTESGRNASKAEGVKFVTFEDGRAVYDIGSGVYHFVSRLDESKSVGSAEQGTKDRLSTSGINGSRVVIARHVTTYPDRPSAKYRLNAVDYGIVLRHGEGPDSCDYLGVRDAWVWKYHGTYYMHYDGAGPKGWLACLATSKNLMDWTREGPVMRFGKKGSKDCASASYGTVYHDGKKWYMFYLGTPKATPAPDYIPFIPYYTMLAESSSPDGPWVKHYDVTPFATKPGTYYSQVASPGCIVKDGDEYLMFFAASPGPPNFVRSLGIARTRNLGGKWTIDAKPILPMREQIENSSMYFEKSSHTYFLFTNHLGLKNGLEYADAIWVYWSKDLTNWNPANKAVVLDYRNCKWSKIIGLPSVIQVGNRLAIFYDGNAAPKLPHSIIKSHMNRDIGLAWLNLPLIPPGN